MKIALVYMNNDKIVSRGVGYLAEAIKDAGHGVEFHDTVWSSDEEVAARIISSGCDVLMISSTSLYFERAKRIAERVKSTKEVPIIVGGIHATLMPNEILDCKYVDYICVGEGEEFVGEFLSAMGTPGLFGIQNLGWKDSNGGIHINDTRPPTDLSSLKPFQHSLFNPKSVVQDSKLIPGLTYVFATRGCPYRCTYCCNRSWLELYGKEFIRKQSIDTVIEELLDLKSHYPTKLVYFGDEMVLFDEDYCTELFTRVQDEVKLPYGCMVRIECINSSTTQLLKDTGCRYIGTGIECGDETFRREWLNRKMSDDLIKEVFVTLRGIPKVWITTFNMRGWPVTYDKSLTKSTDRLNKIISPDWIQTTWYCPLPKTPLGDYCHHFDLVDHAKMASVNDYFRQSVLKPIPDGLLTLKEYMESRKCEQVSASPLTVNHCT